jgi:pentatricopeptide repeat protein|eukprot:TRINITY_DN3797_c1_g6_i1.p1 TRINITY_DN3797_c1_g6~~TRINITY_DN3797_c1_g6_i1.p1  ORF type:complete len:723 (+),score=97.91 TRINITY_DN3797_c1_g6_i1:127-2295(+)
MAWISAKADVQPALFSIIEALDVVRAEAVMFGLAAAVYLLMTFGGKVPVLSPRSPKHNDEEAQSRKTQLASGDGRAQARPKRDGVRRIDNSIVNAADTAKLAREIRALGKDGKLDEAITAFESLKRNDVNRSTLVYNSMLDACVQSGAMGPAIEYLQEAKELSLVDVVSFNLVIKGHLASGNTSEAWQLLGDMNRCGISPSHVTYHSFLHTSVQALDRRSAWTCVTQMRAARLKPTSVTCSILLKLVAGPAHEADVPKVLALIEDMETSLDEVLLSSIVEACLKTQRIDLLKEQIRKWQSKGVALQLTAPAYGSMIKAFGLGGDVERVWLLWQEMNRCKVQPSEVTLGCMVDALVMNGSVDGAWQLVQELWNEESQRPLVNTVIYSTILKGFAIARRLDKATALYDEMQARGIPCNTIAYNTMLNAFVRCGDLKRVPKLLEDMRSSSPPVEPDMITYSTIIKGYCSFGDLDKGLALLQDMEAGGQFAPDEVMYNSLLDGCAKQQRLEDALSLLKKMRVANVAPSNYTLSIMIKLLGRSKRLNQAFAMVQEMTSEQGFRPNIQVYTCLMQACFHNKQLSKALALHDQCVEENCRLDEMAYTSLARGCIQSGSLEKAVDVVRCAMGLHGHSLKVARGGHAPGIDDRCVQEVLKKLSSTGKEAIAARLCAEIEQARGKGNGKSNGGSNRAVTVASPIGKHPWRRPGGVDGCDSSGSRSPRSNSSE